MSSNLTPTAFCGKIIIHMNKIKILLFVLLILAGAFLFVYGEFDDSPGAQGLGLILIIVTVVIMARRKKKNNQL